MGAGREPSSTHENPKTQGGRRQSSFSSTSFPTPEPGFVSSPGAKSLSSSLNNGKRTNVVSGVKRNQAVTEH